MPPPASPPAMENHQLALLNQPGSTITQSEDDVEAATHFFKLPPELRNRIYEDVLGGHAIHVRELDTDEPSVGATICAKGKDYISPDGNNGILDRQIIATKHQDCLTSAKSHLALNLLLVCRQIHQEAALIAFASNDFFIETYGNWTFAESCFTARQLSVMKKLSVQYYETYYRLPYVKRQTLPRFANLRHLSLTILDPKCGKLCYLLRRMRELPKLETIDIMVLIDRQLKEVEVKQVEKAVGKLREYLDSVLKGETRDETSGITEEKSVGSRRSVRLIKKSGHKDG